MNCSGRDRKRGSETAQTHEAIFSGEEKARA